MDLFPIYVASKGRPYSSQTLRGLESGGLPYTVFVEPQEQALYARDVRLGGLAVLERNDQGLGYVRNAILRYAQQRGDGWYWLLDDDITTLATVDAGRLRRVPWGALANAQAYFAAEAHVAQAALEYWQFAWSARQPAVRNSYCDVCVCIQAQRCRGLRFRPQTGLKVDRDFTLQVLAAGYETVRVTAYAFNAPTNGSNAGGLQPVYATTGQEAIDSQCLAALWGPEVCQVVTKRNGRVDAKIHWRYFRRSATPMDDQHPHG